MALEDVLIPLRGLDLDRCDEARVVERLSSATVVGLGESSHGDHESAQFKCHLIQALVRRWRCAVVILERNVAEMDAYDRYITGETADLTMGDELCPWVIEELRDLLIWLRQWNLTGGNVRLAGMDLQSTAGLPLAVALLDRAGREVPGPVRRLASEAEEHGLMPEWQADALRSLPAVRRAVREQRSSRWIALLADTFRQRLEVAQLARQPGSRPWELRDHFMARNALAQLRRFGRQAKAVIWAHNQHVAAGSASDGSHLRAALGSGYRAVGFTFARGHVNAARPGPDGQVDWRQRSLVAQSPPPGSMEAILDQAAVDTYAVAPGEVAALRTRMRVRNIGAVCVEEEWDHFAGSQVPSESFDLIIHFRTVRPSRLLQRRR